MARIDTRRPTPRSTPGLRHRVCAWSSLAVLTACGGGDGATPDAASAATAGYNVEVAPTQATAFPGSGRLLTLTLKRSGGFTADVAVTLADPPRGVTAEPLVFTGTVASLPMQLVLDDTVAAGSLALTLDASSGGSNVRTASQLNVQPAQPRAKQMVASALAANAIDLDTALLYRLYALTGDPRLPAAYAGSGSTEEDVRLFALIEQRLPQMTPALQAAMRPFLVRPTHPESIYRRPGSPASANANGGSTRKRAAAAPAPTCAAGSQWRSARSAKIPVRVWSECYDDDGLTAWNTANAEKTMQVFEKVYASMVALMGTAPRRDVGDDDNGGDDAIDVYIVGSYALDRAMQTIDAAAIGTAYGYAKRSLPCVDNGAGNLACSGYLVLPADKAGSQLQRSTIIHEFFHILQFAHNASLSVVEEWFYEASARWVESHYDREFDWPAKVAFAKVHLPWFKTFMAVDDSVNATSGDRPYASYIWPFFLEQETGSSAIVGRIWKSLASAKTLADEDKAIDDAYGFDANLHRFALRNINEELLPGNPIPKAKRHVQLAGDGQFPDGAVKPRYVTSTISGNSDETRAYGIEPWSAEYARFLVDGTALPNRVEFDFSGLVGIGNLKVDALIRTSTTAGEEWVSEPIALDPAAKAVFCFELGRSTTTVRGEFTELRLVLSNSARNKRINGNLVVRPTKKPCGVWAGSVDSNTDAAIPSGTLKITSTAQVAYAFDEENSGGGSRLFQIRSGSYTYRVLFDLSQRVPPCRTLRTASGVMRPQGTPMDLSDGASAGTLVTFLSPSGTPQYTTDRTLTFQTVTEVSNCNDSNVDQTVVLPLTAIPIWIASQATFDLKLNASTMQDTHSFFDGLGTTTYKWLLTKKTE